MAGVRSRLRDGARRYHRGLRRHLRHSTLLALTRRFVSAPGVLLLQWPAHYHLLTSRLISTMWRGLRRLSPWLVGGCRPGAIRTLISNSKWSIDCANIVVRFGIPSEIVVQDAVSRRPPRTDNGNRVRRSSQSSFEAAISRASQTHKCTFNLSKGATNSLCNCFLARRS